MDSSDHLFAGGIFTTAGSVGASGVAQWNGTAWSALGSGLTQSWWAGRAYSLAFDASGTLFVGGMFDKAGGINAANLARWDGVLWSPVGGGLDGYVLALIFDDSGHLVVGGGFGAAGGNSASHVARWDGVAWSALGNGLDSDVHAVIADDRGGAWAGGAFLNAGSFPSAQMAHWRSSTTPACQCDLNDDGVVSVFDLQAVAFWWLQTDFPPAMDLNADGAVDIRDIMFVSGQLGGVCP